MNSQEPVPTVTVATMRQKSPIATMPIHVARKAQHKQVARDGEHRRVDRGRCRQQPREGEERHHGWREKPRRGLR